MAGSKTLGLRNGMPSQAHPGVFSDHRFRALPLSKDQIALDRNSPDICSSVAASLGLKIGIALWEVGVG